MSVPTADRQTDRQTERATEKCVAVGEFAWAAKSDSAYTLQTNGSHRVPYRTQRFHVERKGSIPSHFQ